VGARHEIQARLRALGEIREVMNAMKNLSLMETRKLRGFLAAQQRVVGTLEAAMADFLAHHEEAAPAAAGPGVYVLIGSERGLCGDFNGEVARAFERERAAQGGPAPQVILVGARLAAQVLAVEAAAVVAGASVAEEVHEVLARLIDALRGRLAAPGALVVIHKDALEHRVEVRVRRPLAPAAAAPRRAAAPRLMLPPAAFFGALLEEHLFASLHESLYGSLMVEHQHRAAHLEGAVQRFDRRAAELARRKDALRKEEITEEIELIMLSAPR
jgi:F-type H+-transporting ATPase subunit gamma